MSRRSSAASASATARNAAAFGSEQPPGPGRRRPRKCTASAIGGTCGRESSRTPAAPENSFGKIIVPTTAFTSGETVTGGTTGASSAISAISSDTTTTWLSKNALNAMLYGSLSEAYIFMKGEADVMQLYERRFMEEVSRLKDLGEARENADAYRQGLPRRART